MDCSEFGRHKLRADIPVAATPRLDEKYEQLLAAGEVDDTNSVGAFQPSDAQLVES